MWHNHNFTMLQESFLCAKRTITTIYSTILLHKCLLPCRRVPQNIINVISCLHSACFQLCSVNYSPNWWKTVIWEEELLNKLFFLRTKSILVASYWLNPWCHMDYFTDVLTMILCLNRANIPAVYGGSGLLQFIKHILICDPKMNNMNKSNYFCHITTAHVPWWVKFLRGCPRQQFTYRQYILTQMTMCRVHTVYYLRHASLSIHIIHSMYTFYIMYRYIHTIIFEGATDYRVSN